MDLVGHLNTDASATNDFLDRIKPVVERLTEKIAAADPHGPMPKIEVAFEDMIEALADANLLVDANTTADADAILVSFVPSPVFERLGDLLAAIYDGIDAKLKAEAEPDAVTP